MFQGSDNALPRDIWHNSQQLCRKTFYFSKKDFIDRLWLSVITFWIYNVSSILIMWLCYPKSLHQKLGDLGLVGWSVKKCQYQQSLVSIKQLYNLKTISYSLQILRNLLVANFEIMIYRIQNLALPPSCTSVLLCWGCILSIMTLFRTEYEYRYRLHVCLISDKSLKVWLGFHCYTSIHYWNILSIVLKIQRVYSDFHFEDKLVEDSPNSKPTF